MKPSVFNRVGLLIVATIITGCSTDQEELQGWMEQQKREVRPNVQPLTPPKKFVPETYAVADGVEPFSIQKLLVALKQEARQSNLLLAAELNRRKDPLEAYPLDNLVMVGSVQRKGETFALIKVDSLLYQVRSGEHLGQNYGKVLKITETEVELREIVQDATGEWIERQSSLQLQESAR